MSKGVRRTFVTTILLFGMLLNTGCGPVTPIPTATPISTTTRIPSPTLTPTIIPTPEFHVGSTWLSPKDGMVMMYVPAGEFIMGSDDGSGVEQPVHTVYLDAYWIDQTEVTNAMYERCVEVGICDLPYSFDSVTRKNYFWSKNSSFADYPVIYITWNDAQAYCKWRGVRLPTEAEWEKAASWDDDRKEQRIYPWGDEISCLFANYRNDEEACVGDTSEVGSYPLGASFYGLLDMAGNVDEWVADWYDDNFYNTSPKFNPTGPSSSSSYSRGLKGGSWYDFDFFVRSSYRRGTSPSISIYGIGFRCARDATP